MKGILNQYGWTAHHRDMAKLLGLDPKAHLPKDGLPPVVIQGWTVHVLSEYEASVLRGLTKKVFVHRVIARCPKCGWQGSAGRTHQHAKIHA